MSLACFVHQKDGSTCPYIVHSDPYSHNSVESQIDDLSRLVTHLMEHISALAERAPDFYKCPEHGTERVYLQGTNEFGWRGYCGICNIQLEKESV